MWRIGVVGGFVESFLCAAQKLFYGRALNIDSYRSSGEYDAVLVLPDADLSDLKVNCRTMVIPEGTVIDNPQAKSVVSYGMSQRNTVTLSSTQEEDHVIALQRDVLTIGGELVLRQEFNFACGLPPYETLALASLLIITGVLE